MIFDFLFVVLCKNLLIGSLFKGVVMSVKLRSMVWPMFWQIPLLFVFLSVNREMVVDKVMLCSMIFGVSFNLLVGFGWLGFDVTKKWYRFIMVNLGCAYFLNGVVRLALGKPNAWVPLLSVPFLFYLFFLFNKRKNAGLTESEHASEHVPKVDKCLHCHTLMCVVDGENCRGEKVGIGSRIFH
jgi:hypothetical protein